MTDQPTSERAPAEDEKLAKMVEECARCWHSYAAHDSAASDHGECTHYGCSCDAFVSPPAPEQGVEPPELLPCPFCGNAAIHRRTSVESSLAPEFDAFWVECGICEVGTKYHGTQRDAAKTWNTRARSVPAEQRELAENLQRELAFYFGQWHGISDHQLGALQCRESECVRIRQLLNRTTKEKD